MTCLFADASTPSANNVLVVLIALASVAGNIATVGLFIVSRKKQEIKVDEPLRIKMANDFVHKTDFEAHVRDNNETFRRLDTQRGEDLRAASMSRKGVYDEIKGTRNDLTDKIEDTKTELTEKIENVPDRVIAILRNFGVIGGKH